MAGVTRILVSLVILTFIGEEIVNGQIPFSIYRNLSQITTTQEFINDFLEPPPTRSEDDIINRIIFTEEGAIHDTGANVIAGMIPMEDACSPRETSVAIPRDKNPNVIFWPTCVSIFRCGGCCGHEMLECAPTEVNMITIEVLKAIYPHPGSSRFNIVGMVSKQLEHHLACQCRCKVQAHHCHSTKQEYLADSCRCRCLNDYQATSCESHQTWDENQCACTCPREYYCLQGEYFNNHTCSCQTRPVTVATTTTSTTQSTTLERTTVSAATTTAVQDPCLNFTCLGGFVPRKSGSRCACIPSPYSQNAGSSTLQNRRYGYSLGGRRRVGRMAESHHPNGGPLEVRQPMVQARNGHV